MHKKIIPMTIVLILVLSSFNVSAQGGPPPLPPEEEKEPERIESLEGSKMSLPTRVNGKPIYVYGDPGQSGVKAEYDGKQGVWDGEEQVFTASDASYEVTLYEGGAVENFDKEEVTYYRVRDANDVEIGTYKQEDLPGDVQNNPKVIPQLASQLRENGLDFDDSKGGGVYSDDETTVKYNADSKTIISSDSEKNTEVAVNAETGNPIYYQEGSTKYEYALQDGRPVIFVTIGPEGYDFPGKTINVNGEQKILYHLTTDETGKAVYFDSEDGGLRYENGESVPEDKTEEILKAGLEDDYKAIRSAVDKQYKLKGEDSIKWRNLKRGFKAIQSALAPIIQGIAQFVHYYNLYSGLAAYGSLFLTGDNWAEWRDKVEKAFCNTILLGGTKCWSSRICDIYLDSASGDNVLITTTPGGAIRAVAHIEGEKSLPLEAVTEDGKSRTQWVYKVTYYIANTDEKRNFNVKFKGPDRIALWYDPRDPKVHLNAGQVAGRTGANPILKVSRYDYKEVCLTFDPHIESLSRPTLGEATTPGVPTTRKVGEICSPLSQYKGAGTTPYKTAEEEEEKAEDEKEKEQFQEGANV